MVESLFGFLETPWNEMHVYCCHHCERQKCQQADNRHRGARHPANCEAALCTEDIPRIIQDVPWNSSEHQDRKHTEAILASDPSPAYTLPRIVCCMFPIATTFPGNSTAVKMEGSWALFGLELALKTQFAHRYSSYWTWQGHFRPWVTNAPFLSGLNSKVLSL